MGLASGCSVGGVGGVSMRRTGQALACQMMSNTMRKAIDLLRRRTDPGVRPTPRDLPGCRQGLLSDSSRTGYNSTSDSGFSGASCCAVHEELRHDGSHCPQ